MEPATSSYSTDEGWHTLPDKHRLYTKTWKPTGQVKALILFLHGFSDHINRFEGFFTTLASRGIEVHGFDQRGWGRSVSKKSERGLTGPTSTVMSDVTSMIEPLIRQSEELNLPLFLMGHSMGGAETLYYAAGAGPENVRRQIRGYVALAPYIKLHPVSQPSRALVVAGRVALKILPNWQMEQKLRPEYISRDPEIGKSWEEDELCHNIGTLEGMGGMIDRGEELEKGRMAVKEGSVYIAHGTSDFITHWETSKAVFEKMPMQDKTLKTYDGHYHCLHGEPGNDKVTFFNDVADWILARPDRFAAANDSDGTRSKL